MRRADRLFQLIQILRRSRHPVTAERLADELEVSRRTVYRDIADLIGQSVPIDGEAGVGYRLGKHYDMPPLMFTADELEAIVLGTAWVQQLPDATLASTASDVLAKITAVIPKKLASVIMESAVMIKPETPNIQRPDTRHIRAAIRAGQKMRLVYCAANGDRTERTVWPVMLGYDQSHCVLIAWCESRQDFRHFRVERMLTSVVLAERIGITRQALKQRWDTWHRARLSLSMD